MEIQTIQVTDSEDFDSDICYIGAKNSISRIKLILLLLEKLKTGDKCTNEELQNYNFILPQHFENINFSSNSLLNSISRNMNNITELNYKIILQWLQENPTFYGEPEIIFDGIIDWEKYQTIRNLGFAFTHKSFDRAISIIFEAYFGFHDDKIDEDIFKIIDDGLRILPDFKMTKNTREEFITRYKNDTVEYCSPQGGGFVDKNKIIRLKELMYKYNVLGPNDML